MATKTAQAERTTQAPPREAPTGNLPATQGQPQEKRKHPIVLFREYVEQRMATLEEALPPHITPKKFVSVVMTALQTKPELLKCTFPSIWNACIRAAHDGLLPDGREGAIAPFGLNEEGKAKAEIATWMPMIEGLRKKIFETGKVKAWAVNVVYEKDEFDYQLGDEAFLIHKPYMGQGSSGGVVGAYSIAKLANDEVVREVMTAYQLQLIQNKSKAKNGPWSDAQAFPEMCKKTIARRHYKQLPHSESLDAIFAREDVETGFADPEAPPIARVERRAISASSMMDSYAGAGETIDHDHETGVVVETNAGGDQQSQQDKAVASETGKPATTASSTNAASEAGGSSAAAKSSGAAASPGAAGEAGASGTSLTGTSDASASTAAATAGSSDRQDDMPDDDLDDGGSDVADRPWPPGTIPTDQPEYERYLTTKLASFQYADDVAPWWNSAEEKKLRADCGISVDEVRAKLQPMAIERRKALPEKPKG